VSHVWNEIDAFLGLGTEAFDLTMWQMAIRAVIIYLVLIALVRIGEKRFLGKHTAVDIILAIVIGSVLSRGINSSAPLFKTIVAGGVLVAMHWSFSAIAFRYSRFGDLVKGTQRQLIKDGEIQWDAMRKSHISEHDLIQSLRLNGGHADPSRVKQAVLERNGDISLIADDQADEPRILDVRVEDGVQIVRIQIG
jgi:uncharacterized membrane protein YcaP (DUF421 family)